MMPFSTEFLTAVNSQFIKAIQKATARWQVKSQGNGPIPFLLYAAEWHLSPSCLNSERLLHAILGGRANMYTSTLSSDRKKKMEGIFWEQLRHRIWMKACKSTRRRFKYFCHLYIVRSPLFEQKDQPLQATVAIDDGHRLLQCPYLAEASLLWWYYNCVLLRLMGSHSVPSNARTRKEIKKLFCIRIGSNNDPSPVRYIPEKEIELFEWGGCYLTGFLWL